MRMLLALLFASALAGAQPGTLTGPLVVSESWPQCTDLASWTRDVMRLEGLQKANETAQGKAFFRWLRLFSRMATGGMIQAYEGDTGKEKYVTDAHKNLFVYGWGYCDTTSRIAEAAWIRYKNDPNAAERVCVQHENGGFHTMYRLRLDGRWGAFDPRYGYYLVERDAPDAAVLDWRDVGDDARILANKTYRHRSAPFFEFFGLEWERALLLEPAYFPSQSAWEASGKPIESVFGNRMYRPGTEYHNMDFELPRGAIIERFWDNSARKFYVPSGAHTKREEPFLPSGRFYRVTETMLDGNWPKYDPNYQKARPYLTTVPKNEGYNREVVGGRTIGQAWGRITLRPNLSKNGIFDYYSPYILVDGKLEGELAANGSVEIRTLRAKALNASEPDHWSEWKPIHTGAGRFSIPLDGTNGFHGVYRFQLRAAPDAARSLKLELYFENNLMSLPQIVAGTNTIHVKVRDASQIAAPVRVIYRYQTAAGGKQHQQDLTAADFRNNVATYRLNAPGLIRCNSVAIEYQ